MEVNSKPIYKTGDYMIYKLWDEHFVHTFKNIVIAQRGAANKDLINNLVLDNKPTNEADLYHDYERPKAAISEGMEAAKNLNFKVK